VLRLKLTGEVKFVNKIHDDFLKGGIFKELIKSLLQKSGYDVYPYGYETTFSVLKSKLSAGDVRNSPSVRRMKSTPDLVVFDKNNQDLMFVEVKMRSNVPAIIKSRQIEGYQDFWNDCILVLVVPDENIFYAQRVSALQKKEIYHPTTDFCRMREFFTGVDENDLQHYRMLASNLFSSMKPLK
jgi:hypothetical protein